jgi:hypothetical protein
MTAKEREDKLFTVHYKFEEFNKNFAKRSSKSRHIRDVAQRAFTTAEQIDRECELFGTVDLFVEFINLTERLINEALEITK